MTITSLTICFLIILCVPLNPLALAKDEDQFIYNGFQGAQNLELQGFAKIFPNGLLQLTNSSKQQIGRAFFRLPIKFNTPSTTLSFSTNFVFAIFPQMQNFSGHGMAFAITPSLDFNHTVGSQYFGLLNFTSNGLDSNHLLAIEFDTVIDPEFKDINDNHVGIDVNSLTSIQSAPALYFSDKDGKNNSLGLYSGNPIQVWIDYDEVESQLNVTLAPMRNVRPEKPLLSASVNLSTVLKDYMYVGFSGSTGSLVDGTHYILGWSFNKSGKAQDLQISQLPTLPRQPKAGKKLSIGITISMIVAASFVMIISIMGLVYFVRKKRYEELHDDWEEEYGPHRFSYKDLYIATKGFADAELLGAGGFGKVYRGVLPSSKEQVAVKKVSHDSKQGMKEFVAEIASMGRLRHRNLVKLLGYSRRRGELILVYDYMPNGSLDKYLFSNEKQTLSWSQRHRIIRGVASGLLYLHEESEQVVLHRDVKASNVLLDAELNGRLGDFGLARLYDHGANPETTHVVGTVGYLAPELARRGKATTRTDVFAFGAFMLEVACGRRPIELLQLPEEEVLVDWVLDNWNKGTILRTVDPKLGGDYVEEEVELVLKVGLICSHTNATTRPSMRQVVQFLDGDAIFPETVIDVTGIGTLCVGNESSADYELMFPSSAEYPLTFPSSVENYSARSLSSSESILKSGR